nr:helix-turn-helix transcriptional regulator [Clostridia bacterium]
MICNEKGVLTSSEYFFFPENENINRYYYHIPVMGHFYCDKNYRIERNGGVVPLLFLIIGGNLHVRTAKLEISAQPGDVVLLDCSKYHHYYCDDSCEFLFIHFTGSNSTEITDYLTEGGKRMVFSDNEGKIFNSLSNTLKDLQRGKNASAYDLSRIVSSLLTFLPEDNDISPLEHSQHPALIEAAQYIRSNLTNEITLDDIADHAHISKYHLCKLFREHMGTTPLEYVSQARINLAETMLITTGSSITKIAEDLCYSSSASFINAFRLRKGITPGIYRKNALSRD